LIAEWAGPAVLWAGRHGDPHGDQPGPGLLELTIADVMAAVREVRILRTGGGFNHVGPGSAKQHGRTPAQRAW
jgi:hypothetical protein